MADLPDGVAAALVRGISAFIRTTPAHELPASLRRFRNLRPQALKPHRAKIVGALDDDALRVRILDWLDKEKPSLAKADAELLRTATERKSGYEQALTSGAPKKATPRREPADPARRLEAERAKVQRARDETRRVKEEARSQIAAERKKAAELAGETGDLKKRIVELERAMAAARRESERSEARLERELRKSRSTMEKAMTERDEARRRQKEARDEAASLRREVTSLRARIERLQRTKKPTPSRRPSPAERKPLSVPKGRLEDDPETLREWLKAPRVHLLIDGYNAAKSEGAFGKLDLEAQRDRLIDSVAKVARRKGGRTVIVFDGSKVPPGVARRSRGPVIVEYSRPDEIADDHIVARLEELPGDPVILVTSDRELQDRGRALGATIATSPQLLGLIR